MNSALQVHIFDTEKEITNFMVEKWKEICDESIALKGRFSVALSGGKTPTALYRELASARCALPWGRTHIFLVDERFVPYTHRDSNFGMISGFLNPAGIPFENLHPMPTDGPTPEISADRYEHGLRVFFRQPQEGIPEFDLVILGLGDDGHTASLFPGNPALKESKRLVAVVPEGPVHKRLTLTLPVINKAKSIIFLVLGKSKAAMLKRVLRGKDTSLPAALVKPEHGDLLLVADREAASEL